jgi:hypothetical protein
LCTRAHQKVIPGEEGGNVSPDLTEQHSDALDMQTAALRFEFVWCCRGEKKKTKKKKKKEASSC